MRPCPEQKAEDEGSSWLGGAVLDPSDGDLAAWGESDPICMTSYSAWQALLVPDLRENQKEWGHDQDEKSVVLATGILEHHPSSPSEQYSLRYSRSKL